MLFSRGHTSYITCICVHDTFVITGSADNTVRKWDAISCNCLYTYTGETLINYTCASYLYTFYNLSLLSGHFFPCVYSQDSLVLVSHVLYSFLNPHSLTLIAVLIIQPYLYRPQHN